MTVMMKVFQVLLLLNFVWTLTRGDIDVSCQFGETCVFPCRFSPGHHILIHWHLNLTVQVHSFFDDQDQLGQQDQQFKGRTSLFLDQILEGNASLLLTGVKVKDEGRYQCYTSTMEEDATKSYVNVKLTAPLQKINMTQTKNLIICSSDEIYPKPHLSWSISPPSSRTFQNKTTVQKTEKHLYNISSSLTLSDSEEDLDHICTISTPSKQRRASWRRRHSVTIISGEATISCSALDSSLKGLSLVWRFNQREKIVTKNEDDEHRVSEEWKQHVKDVSESGRLTLQHLSADHEGTYTCEVSNDGDTSMAQISLRLAEGKGEKLVFLSEIRDIPPCSRTT
uniref:Ig-like domain-containing protein n=1 Tax=Oryzias melastigma TaxID=30732 RepID=A0A3B3DB65_ORYME